MPQPENLLLVFFGMIATGKSYLASAWAQQYGLPCYNSDRVRKELAGLPPETGQLEEVDKGIYTPEFSRRTYDALIEHAESHFQANKQACVVLDGSYQSLSERDLLREHFSGRVRLVFVHCFCSEAVVKERLAVRAADPNAVSDGNWKIYLAQKKRFQPVTEREEVIEIDTDAPVEALVERVNKEVMNIE
ncbi:MAG: AAA family ATPase [Desulfocapsa sp.]|nr:AAA family ATPase [Desulfocapsa sp.]